MGSIAQRALERNITPRRKTRRIIFYFNPLPPSPVNIINIRQNKSRNQRFEVESMRFTRDRDQARLKFETRERHSSSKNGKFTSSWKSRVT